MTQQNTNHPIEEDEIDLIALAKKLWEGRKTVIKITLIFMAIGLFIAIFSPKEYTASTTIIPQTSKKKVGGSLSGLAAMAGINLGGMSSESGIPPSLYPQIVSSIPFQKELLQTPLTIEGQPTKISFSDYYTSIHRPGLLGYLKKYTIGLPGIIISAIKGKATNNQRPITFTLSEVEGNNQLLSITGEESELIRQLNSQVLLEVNDKEDYIKVSAIFPEAIAAAELANQARELLQNYILNFKVQKSLQQLKFIKERYQEKEKEFKLKQQQLAHFRDRNQNVTTAVAQTKLEILKSEYELAYGVFAELAKQLETQKIQVKEDTPVFTVITPVSIPNERSKPRRSFILIAWSFLGVALGIGSVFLKTFLVSIKKKWITIES